MKIPLTKPVFGEEEERAVADVLKTGWVMQGPKVAEFEKNVADYVGCSYAIATSSCTTALHLALLVSGVKPGDEVLCPSLSFIATANAILYCGAIPVFVDIDASTYNMDATRIEEAITPRTRAILPVHQSQPAEMDVINDIARRRGILVVEDAAPALGCEYKGKRVGNLGNIACFSFHPRKIITTGEGGMITTNASDLAAKLRRLRNHGVSAPALERHLSDVMVIEQYDELGYNYRMTDLQAAIGIEQMKRLDWIIQRRRELAQIYDDYFKGIPWISPPTHPPYNGHTYQSYIIRLVEDAPIKRDELVRNLLSVGVSARRGIMAIHREKHCKVFARGANLPQTEKAADQTIILPLYPTMTTEEQMYVLDKVDEVIKRLERSSPKC